MPGLLDYSNLNKRYNPIGPDPIINSPTGTAMVNAGVALVDDAMLKSRAETLNKWNMEREGRDNARTDARNKVKDEPWQQDMDRSVANDAATAENRKLTLEGQQAGRAITADHYKQQGLLDTERLAQDKRDNLMSRAQESRNTAYKKGELGRKFDDDIRRKEAGILYNKTGTKDTSLDNNVKAFVKSMDAQLTALQKNEYPGDTDLATIKTLKKRILFAQKNNLIPDDDYGIDLDIDEDNTGKIPLKNGQWVTPAELDAMIKEAEGKK